MSATCSCGAAIIWARHTETGSRMPLEAAPDTTGLRFQIVRQASEVTARRVTTDGELGHRSHYATCPDAQQHRRGRQTRA